MAFASKGESKGITKMGVQQTDRTEYSLTDASKNPRMVLPSGVGVPLAPAPTGRAASAPERCQGLPGRLPSQTRAQLAPVSLIRPPSDSLELHMSPLLPICRPALLCHRRWASHGEHHWPQAAWIRICSPVNNRLLASYNIEQTKTHFPQ